MRFRDRTEAGTLLAERLQGFRGEPPVVLGLACGGLPVAAEVARALGVPLEPMVVRTVGAPVCPEFVLGAIAEGGGAYVDPDALLEAGLRDADVEAIGAREAGELARRVRRFRGDRAFPDVHGRTAIVVSDGVAAGARVRAAARALRAAGATRVVLAAPVVAAERLAALQSDYDEVVALAYPDPLVAVAVWYERFGEVSEDEARALLPHRAGPTGAHDVGAGADDVTPDTSGR